MPEDIDPSFVEPLRGLVEIISGARHFFMAIASTAPEPAAPEDETPEDCAALIGSALRCIVNDHLDPAIRSLEGLIEALLQAPSSEPET
jgi:hypothetical protein